MVAALFAVQAGAIGLLPFIGRNAIAAIVGFGLGFGLGVAAIAKPVLLADRFDTRRYATVAGTIVLPVTIARAGAPLATAVTACRLPPSGSATRRFGPPPGRVRIRCAGKSGRQRPTRPQNLEHP